MSAAATLKDRIEAALADTSDPHSAERRATVDALLDALESGEIRAAERDSDGNWGAVTWVKRGILLGFQVGILADMSPPNSVFRFFDKNTYPPRQLTLKDGVRVVPGGSTIRR